MLTARKDTLKKLIGKTISRANGRKQKRSLSTPGHFAFPAGKSVVAKN